MPNSLCGEFPLGIALNSDGDTENQAQMQECVCNTYTHFEWYRASKENPGDVVYGESENIVAVAGNLANVLEVNLQDFPRYEESSRQHDEPAA